MNKNYVRVYSDQTMWVLLDINTGEYSFLNKLPDKRDTMFLGKSKLARIKKENKNAKRHN